jgi:Zn-dependent protease
MNTEFLYYIPILIFSVVIHEIAHGWVALKFGDTTARDLGRLTLNPIPHIDPIGTILMPLLGLLAGSVFIAWAKPVPVNPLNLRNWKRDDILVTIAGPVSNILMAAFCTFLVILFSKLSHSITPDEGSFGFLFIEFMLNMFYAGITLNVLLAIFNMLPIPPLDGSHIIAHLLPENAALKFRSIGFGGIFILLLLFNFIPGFSQLFYNVIRTVASPFIAIVNYFI